MLAEFLFGKHMGWVTFGRKQRGGYAAAFCLRYFSRRRWRLVVWFVGDCGGVAWGVSVMYGFGRAQSTQSNRPNLDLSSLMLCLVFCFFAPFVDGYVVLVIYPLLGV